MNKLFFTNALRRIKKLDRHNLEKCLIDLEQDEHLMSQILDRVREGVLLVDQRFNVRFINRTAAVILAYSNDVRSGTPLHKVVEDVDFRTFIEKTMQQRRHLTTDQFELFIPRHIKMDVTIQTLQESSSNSNEERLYLISFLPFYLRDEQRLESEQKKRMSSLLSLAAGIGHEIGNPLNSMMIHLRLMENDISKLKPAERKSIEPTLLVLKDETKRLDEIARRFMSSTRRKPLYFKRGQINDLIQQVLNLMSPELKLTKIKVTLKLDQSLQVFYFDEDRLYQVFLNLIKNSIQAMPKGGEMIITTKQQKNVCIVGITDTGMGIHKEDLPKIFDAYYTTKEEGSGLGLMVAYQLIREHGGRIDIESKVGGGTTAIIRLPIRKDKLELPAPKGGEKS